LNDGIKQILANYGLSDKEVKIYLALLTNGNATAKELSFLTKIKRTSIYPLAEKMVAKGILGIYQAKYGTHYIATSPRSLMSRLDKIKNDLTTALPQLEALENKKSNNEPEVKFYKGKDGYISILDDSLADNAGDILYFGSADDLNDVISESYANRYIKKRVQQNIKFLQIVRPDEFSKTSAKIDTRELRQTKFIPENFKFSGNKVIFKDKVAFFSSKKELASLVIKSADMAEMERKNFMLLWEKL
jgi:sugar-specific transcriptional regulator TrmB